MKRRNAPTSQQKLLLENQAIPYTLTFSDRKSLGITIRPDSSIEVTAPYRLSQSRITELLTENSPKILRSLREFAERAEQPAATMPLIIYDGESYLYLGNRLPVTIRRLNGRKAGNPQVTLGEDSIDIWADEEIDSAQIASRLEKWRREQAFNYLFQRTYDLLVRFNGLIKSPPDMKVRRMKARWGSCNSKGDITYNLNLIHLQPASIDYVVVHELCHLVELNHSPRFYDLLDRVMPDWKARRDALKLIPMPRD